MNKRQRKKAGLRAKPSRSSCKAYSRYLRTIEHSMSSELDKAILEMTVGEIQNQELAKLNRAAENVFYSVLPVENPRGEMTIISVSKQLPGEIRKVTINFKV